MSKSLYACHNCNYLPDLFPRDYGGSNSFIKLNFFLFPVSSC